MKEIVISWKVLPHVIVKCVCRSLLRHCMAWTSLNGTDLKNQFLCNQGGFQFNVNSRNSEIKYKGVQERYLLQIWEINLWRIYCGGWLGWLRPRPRPRKRQKQRQSQRHKQRQRPKQRQHLYWWLRLAASDGWLPHAVPFVFWPAHTINNPLTAFISNWPA